MEQYLFILYWINFLANAYFAKKTWNLNRPVAGLALLNILGSLAHAPKFVPAVV